MNTQLGKFKSEPISTPYSHSSIKPFLQAVLEIKKDQQQGHKKIFVIAGTDDALDSLYDFYPSSEIIVGLIPRLEELRTVKREQHFNYVTVDPATLQFTDDTFDIVICSEAFSHLPEYRNLFRELLRVLKPGMPLVVTAHRATWFNLFSKKDKHLRTFTARELTTMFQDFHITNVRPNKMFSPSAVVFGKKHLLRVKHSGVVHLPSFEDSKGGILLSAEFGKTVPFDAKRIYVISSISGKDAVRGGHVHKTLDQAIFCVSGSFQLRIDDGMVHQKITLKNNGYGIRLGPKLWHSMRKFSSDCVILVLASDFYDESDYIRKYEDFMTYIAQNP